MELCYKSSDDVTRQLEPLWALGAANVSCRLSRDAGRLLVVIGPSGLTVADGCRVRSLLPARRVANGTRSGSWR